LLFTVYDPEGLFQLPRKHETIVSRIFNSKFGFADKLKWTTSYAIAPETFGDAGLQGNCGPFVCFFAESEIKDWNVLSMPDMDAYRNHIIATIQGDCSFGSRKKSLCHVCELPSKIPLQKCSLCEMPVHTSCLKHTNIRGEWYYICETPQK